MLKRRQFLSAVGGGLALGALGAGSMGLGVRRLEAAENGAVTPL